MASDAEEKSAVKTIGELIELCLELLRHPVYSPDWGPSDYWLFADFKRMPQQKRFGVNEETSRFTKKTTATYSVTKLIA